MIPEPSLFTKQVENEADSISSQLRAGLGLRALELIILGYKKMYADGRFDPKWKENKFTAVLKGYVIKTCPEFSRKAKKQWHIEREHYHDNEDIISGEGDPDKAPRIDIVVLTWTAECEGIKFPFECKLINETNSKLIRLYIEKGLKDRYLTGKDYSEGTSWGGMIGYILTGKHQEIAQKLNEQIDRQLKDKKAHLEIHQPIVLFEAIYKSRHEQQNMSEPLTIIHLLLSFFET